MKDEKTKLKETKLIELVSDFCDENLDDEFKTLCINLVEKMGRKHDVPFRRGKLEIWASSVVYAIAQINFLFDKSSDLYISPDNICDYFDTKKSTVSNKAKTIRDMFNMGHFDKEFSTRYVLNDAPQLYIDEDSGFIIPKDYISDPMDDFFDETYELFEKGNVDEALGMLDTISKDNPEYPRAQFYKSMMMGASGDEDEAFKLFQDAIMSQMTLDMDESELMELSLGDDESLYVQALNFANIDDFQNALDFINAAIDVDSQNDMYWNDKGNFLTKLESYSEAQKSFDKAIELNPNDSVIWSNKAFAYLEEGNIEKAEHCYLKAIEINPDDVDSIVGMADVYVAKEDLDTAGNYFKKAREIDENNIKYLTDYGHFMLIQMNFDKAIESWDKCLEIDAEQPLLWMYKAIAYTGLENDKMVDECVEKACEIDPMVIFAFDDLMDE